MRFVKVVLLNVKHINEKYRQYSQYVKTVAIFSLGHTYWLSIRDEKLVQKIPQSVPSKKLDIVKHKMVRLMPFLVINID